MQDAQLARELWHLHDALDRIAQRIAAKGFQPGVDLDVEVTTGRRSIAQAVLIVVFLLARNLLRTRHETLGPAKRYNQGAALIPLRHARGQFADAVDELRARDQVLEAVAVLRDAKKRTQLQKNGMNEDFSWSRSVEEYQDLYADAIRWAQART